MCSTGVGAGAGRLFGLPKAQRVGRAKWAAKLTGFLWNFALRPMARQKGVDVAQLYNRVYMRCMANED